MGTEGCNLAKASSKCLRMFLQVARCKSLTSWWLNHLFQHYEPTVGWQNKNGELCL